MHHSAQLCNLRSVENHKPNKYYTRGTMLEMNTNVVVIHLWLLELDLMPPSTMMVPASIQSEGDWPSWNLVAEVARPDTTKGDWSSRTLATRQPTASPFSRKQTHVVDPTMPQPLVPTKFHVPSYHTTMSIKKVLEEGAREGAWA